VLAQRLYRISGALVGHDEFDTLATLGLRTVIDLRGHDEDREPLARFTASQGVAYRHIPIPIARPEQLAAVADSLDEARDLIDRVYLTIVKQYGTGLAEAICALDSPLPAGFGCAAGKDRTGILSAVLQRVLGVPDSTIVREYLRCAPNPARVRDRLLTVMPPGYQPGPGFDYILGVSADALMAALRWIDCTYGDTGGYLEAMGTSPATIARLRTTLLESSPSPF
jgi:protein-tyrosine phosphatase